MKSLNKNKNMSKNKEKNCDIDFGDFSEEMLMMDGFDDCIVGVVERFGQEGIICYDKAKVLEKLMTESGMSEEEATDFFYYNQIGAWMGDLTPCFLTTIDQ